MLLFGERYQRRIQRLRSTHQKHTLVHEQLTKFFSGFRRDSHPMAVMCGVSGALAAFYHDAIDVNNQAHRELTAIRLLAKSQPLRRCVINTLSVSRLCSHKTTYLTPATSYI